MVNSISIKQVIYYYKNFIVENELWCILLASLQDQYRKLKSGKFLKISFFYFKGFQEMFFF
jgi:hypothetical protein